MMRIPLISAIGLLCYLPLMAGAAEAAFSEDGKTVWVISQHSDALLAFTHSLSSPRTIPLPEGLTGDDKPSDLLADHNGLLMLGAGKLSLWNPSLPETPPKKIAPLPPAFTATGITRAQGEGLEDAILIAGHHWFDSRQNIPRGLNASATLYALKPGEKQFSEIFVRRVHNITASPAFQEGRMVFGGDNDLWEGGISPEPDVPERFGVLWGHRTAPLAANNTDEANGEGPGVRSVEIAGGLTWSILSGHHSGASLVTIPLSAKRAGNDEESHPGLSESWKLQKDQLSDTKIIPVRETPDQSPNDSLEWIDALAAWHAPDGNWKITYRTAHSTVWIISKDQPEPQSLGTGK